MSPPSTLPLAGPAAPRTCGRCQATFVGDPDLPQGLDTGWWACDPCRGRLFGVGALPAKVRARGEAVR